MAEYYLDTIQKKASMQEDKLSFFLDDEESSLGDDICFGERSFEELKEESESSGNNTETQKKLGIDINMIGARAETLGRTRSETKGLSSPTNESMETAD